MFESFLEIREYRFFSDIFFCFCFVLFFWVCAGSLTNPRPVAVGVRIQEVVMGSENCNWLKWLQWGDEEVEMVDVESMGNARSRFWVDSIYSTKKRNPYPLNFGVDA